MRLLPPADGRAPFALHLLLDEGDPGRAGGPWVTLSEPDELSRVLLAAVLGDRGTLLEVCALKLVPDAWPEDPGAPTNADLEARWQREEARLAELRGLSPHFPRLLKPEASGPREEPGRLPPLLYAVPERRLFSPPCARCRAPLALCRDEAWLAASGLPAFSSTAARYLWCPDCAKGPDPSPVYGSAPATPAHVPVRSPADLLEDVARALREGTEEDAAALAGAETARAARAKAAARDLFVPLTLYGSPYLLTAAEPLDLEALADALGGRPWEDVVRTGTREASPFPPRWAWLAKAPPPVRRTLFSPEGSGLDAAEIFFLKLTAFRQVLDGLVDWYRVAGRPHLDLHPRHLLFALSGAGDGLPAYWTLEARIHGLASAAVPLPGPGSPAVVLPGAGLAPPYAAPEVQEFRLAGPRPGEFQITDVDEEGGGRFRLRGTLRDPYGLFPAPGPRDTILLSLPDPTLGFGFTALSVKAVAGEIRPDETAFASDLVALEESGLKRLRLALGTRLPGGRYRVFPDFGAPADLYALGVVLLRLLLRNEDQDLASVLKAVERLAREVAAWPVEARRDATLTALLKRVPDAAAAFAKGQVFWGRDERRPGRPNAIPDALWGRALALALRLVARVPGFSVAAGPSDFDPLFREEKLERILPEVGAVLAELRALLFARQSLNLEIQQVLAELREDDRRPGARA